MSFVSGLLFGTTTASSRESSTEVVEKAEWLDPVGTIIRLAVLAFRSSGTKISISNHEIHNDHYYFLIQAFKRTFLTGGAKEDLHNLSAPVFHAVKWLQPNKDPKAQVIFLLARKGLEELVSTYKGQTLIQQYLKNTLMKMIDEGLKGNPLKEEDFHVSSWDTNPLAQESKKIWEKNRAKIEAIADLFSIASKAQEKGEVFEDEIAYVKSAASRVAVEVNELYTNIGRGTPISSKPTEEKPEKAPLVQSSEQKADK